MTSPSAHSPGTPQHPRILLIEDDPQDARLLQEMLREAEPQAEVLHATTIAESARHLHDAAIDAVLLDLHLPDARGLEAVAAVHAGGIGQPILVLTGRGESDVAVEALRLGAQDYLVKDSLDPKGLARALRNAIERQRLLACMRDSVQASHSSEEDLRRLLLQGAEALLVVGCQGELHFASQLAEQLFGRTARELSADPLVLECVPGREMDHEIVRPDGSRVLTEMRCVNVMWRGHPAMLVSLRDVSERRLAAEHEVRLELLNGFLSNMSHELRTPLSAIYQFVSNVRDGVCGPVNGEQSDQLSGALRNVDEVLSMVANLLEVARAQSGKLRLEPRLMYLTEELRVLVPLHARTAESVGVTFAVEWPEALPALLSDPGRVRQIVNNLCENAIKFTPRGGRVTLSARRDPSENLVRLTVRDTGCGVPAEHLEHIFDQLHQVPDTTYRTRRGLGLGLYITRELVRGLGGDIRVRSEPGRGAEFEISLPTFDWEALLQPIAPVLTRPNELHAVIASIGWPDDVADEPIPQAPVTLLAGRLAEAVRPGPHALVPPIPAKDILQLGAVVAAPRTVVASLVRALDGRLRDEPLLAHSGLDLRLRAVRLASNSRAVTTLELSHSLGQLFGHPNSRGAACRTPA